MVGCGGVWCAWCAWNAFLSIVVVLSRRVGFLSSFVGVCRVPCVPVGCLAWSGVVFVERDSGLYRVPSRSSGGFGGWFPLRCKGFGRLGIAFHWGGFGGGRALLGA